MAMQFTYQLDIEAVQATMQLIGRSRSSASVLKKPWVFVTYIFIVALVVFLVMVNFPEIVKYKMYAAVALATFLFSVALFVLMHLWTMQSLKSQVTPIVITCTMNDTGLITEQANARTEYKWSCFGKMIKGKKYCVLLYDRFEIIGLCFPMSQLNDDILMLLHSKIPEVVEV